MYHFGGPWVRIQARTENVSLIFFWADFSTFSYLNCFSHNLEGVHKPCGPSKTRGRDCLAAYGINEFDVVARVSLATSATITVVEFAKNSAKTTRKVTKILLQNFLQFCNVTVSCVGY